MLLPHGEYYLEWQDDILILNISGPYNKEGINALILKLQDSILCKNLSSWKRIIILDEEALSTPETFTAIRGQSSWLKEHGCIANALVYKMSLQAELFENLAEKSGMQYKAFTSKSEALSWLRDI